MVPNPTRRDTITDELTIAGRSVPKGKRVTFDLEVGRLPSGTMESIPVSVINGRKPGPRVWLSGAIHGDELNGIEIVRRLVGRIHPKTLAGSVVAVPIVNVFGFLSQSRYLPDGRDLNRSFPGSARGSLASRLAHTFMNEIVAGCDLGVDFHTAAGHRTNIPQIRANLDNAETLELANVFGAPFSINSSLRDGSIRQAATERGIKVLLFEGGQVMRFEEEVVDSGVDGTLRVLGHLGMGSWDIGSAKPTIEIRKTRWVRAGRSGVLSLDVDLGDKIEKGQIIGQVGDVLGGRRSRIRAGSDGYIIATNLNPLVSPGDALAHIAVLGESGKDEPAVKRSRKKPRR